MNRERLLFVAVLAIVALWWFVIREDHQPRRNVDPGTMKVDLLDVTPPSPIGKRLRDGDVFTLRTNERPHPRPELAAPKPIDLPGIWPPTSRSVGVVLYDRLRRPVVDRSGEDGSLSLPPAPSGGASEDDDAGQEGEGEGERWDEATLNNRVVKLRVEEIRVNGERIREPRQKPPIPDAANHPFYRGVAMLEIEPGASGVNEARVRLTVGGTVAKPVGDDLNGFTIAQQGADRNWWRGLEAYIRASRTGGFGERLRVGKRLLADGARDRDKALLQWAFAALSEARERMPARNRSGRQDVLLHLLECASLLNEQEVVLSLAFEYLARFPQDPVVLEYIGGVLASRSFDLPEMARDLFAQANSPSAQRRRVEIMIRLGQYEDARDVLRSGKADTGAEVDLLSARVALALGDYERATTLARNRANGEWRAEARQILGGVAYAKGDAAGAAREFEAAVTADPRRSTAYSDLGLALAVQGRAADARRCFERARLLDPIDNVVIPPLGDAWIDLEWGRYGLANPPDTKDQDELRAAREKAQGMIERALAKFASVEDNNGNSLLARFFHGYALERTGSLEQAGQKYRATLDADHRYRVAITRLGFVLSKLIEDGKATDRTAETINHLAKAVELNPDTPEVAYVLGRFLMLTQGKNTKRARAMFARVRDNRAELSDKTLALWAEAADAALLYRDDSVEERRVRAALNEVRDRIRDAQGSRDERWLMANSAVFRYATDLRDAVVENTGKVDLVWTFRKKLPREWQKNATNPTRINVGNEGIEFEGSIDYGGKGRQDRGAVFERGSVMYPPANGSGLSGRDFYEVVVEGRIPEDSTVDFGVAVANPPRSGRGPEGIKVRRRRDGRVDVKIEGAERKPIKALRGRRYYLLDKVEWPAGDFTLSISLAGGDKDRRQGEFIVLLNGRNIFEEQFGREGVGEDEPVVEQSTLLRRRGARAAHVFAWVEGSEGRSIPGILVKKVVLTKRKQD